MCRRLVSTVILAFILLARTRGDIEELNEHSVNAYGSPVVNFHDIFSNSLAMLADEPNQNPPTKEEDHHVHSIPTQFVEFYSKVETTTGITPPPPIYILSSSYLRQNTTTESTTNANPSTEPPSSTEKAEDRSEHVIPIKNEKEIERENKNVQKGVLDLLFPPPRVKTFKGVFDTFRRILSYTFR